ncbi:MAG TPA: glycosyltransferase family 2 protein [Chroococcales cyanobacterium]
MKKNKKLAVLIVNHNTQKMLSDCLKSIEAENFAFSVWVVDNGSSDESVALLKREHPSVQLIESPENLGFAGGNNLGLKEILKGEAEYILLLNSDTLLQKGALEALVRTMEEDERIGILGGKLLNPDLSPQPSCVPLRFPRPYSSPEKDCEAVWVSGACLLIRRETLQEIGLLDEIFFYTGEDFDWGLRARKAGWKVAFANEARVIHFGAQTGKMMRDRTIQARHLGRQHFYQKHYGAVGLFYARAQSSVELLAAMFREPEKKAFYRNVLRESLAFHSKRKNQNG